MSVPVSTCFKILFQLIKKDHWRTAPALVTWTCWDADLLEELGARRE
jgi:hypothetical protein